MAQTRRKLASSAALLAMIGAAAGATKQTSATPMTPITIAGKRLAYLSAIDQNNLTDDEAHTLCVEQCDLAALIMDSPPQTVVDAVVLLMVAATETLGGDMNENGTFGSERGDIMVRRVMVFLAGQAGVSLSDYGGAFFLCSDEHEALAHEGTVTDAAARFNLVSPSVAKERFQDRHDLNLIRMLRDRRVPGGQERIERLVKEASQKWENISDDDPLFDAGRAMLERAGITLPVGS